MQADFYVLKSNTNRELFACKLVEKGYLQQKRLHIYTNDRPQAELLNELLWTFKDGSFLPHEIINDSGSIDHHTPSITISYISEHSDQNTLTGDILLNLSAQIPSFLARFPRVIEVINDNDAIKASGRQHFSHYRSQGYQLNHYDIN